MKIRELFESSHSPTYQELVKLANEFKKEFDGEKGRKEWGAPLRELEDENGTCSMVSNTFIDWLNDRGIHSTFITGEAATNRKWNDIPKEYGEGDGHTAVQVGMYVVDFTARQFDKSFPNPRIIEVGDFDDEWKKII
jgi:hypothetical protein